MLSKLRSRTDPKKVDPNTTQAALGAQFDTFSR